MIIVRYIGDKVKYISFLLVFISINVFAAKPGCSLHNGSYYFHYKGPVKTIYANESNLILIYFEAPMSVEEVASCGLTVSSGAAGSYAIDDNPEYAKLLYSTALAAQASGRDVSIQMRAVRSGYLKIDRIWL